MILNEATIKYAGYDPRELKPKSNKRVCRACDVCGRVRWVVFSSCSDLCLPCSTRTDERIRNLSAVLTGREFTDEHCRNIAICKTGKKMPPITDATRAKMSKSATERKREPYTDEARQHQSAGQQGIAYEEWEGFVTENTYCELFDDACRERIRAKYGHRCYICDKPQKDNVGKNGNVRKLSVHHIDRNRGQGCDGVQWKLVPLCMHCHSGAHGNPVKSRLEYLLNDEDV